MQLRIEAVTAIRAEEMILSLERYTKQPLNRALLYWTGCNGENRCVASNCWGWVSSWRKGLKEIVPSLLNIAEVKTAWVLRIEEVAVSSTKVNSQLVLLARPGPDAPFLRFDVAENGDEPHTPPFFCNSLLEALLAANKGQTCLIFESPELDQVMAALPDMQALERRYPKNWLNVFAGSSELVLRLTFRDSLQIFLRHFQEGVGCFMSRPPKVQEILKACARDLWPFTPAGAFLRQLGLE